MNAKQRSSNDEPNRDPNSPNENQLAEQTARVLELRSLEGQTQKAQSQDDQATAELGQLLREAAKSNLPESNLDLQDLLLTELDGGTSATESDQVVLGEKSSSSEVASRSTGRRFWIAAAASGLLLVGGTIAYNAGYVGSFNNVALLEEDQNSPIMRLLKIIREPPVLIARKQCWSQNARGYVPDGNDD